MIKVILKDGKELLFSSPVTVLDVARQIGPRLAQSAIAGMVNGKLVDLSFTIEDSVSLSIITNSDAEGLDILRHSAAHLLAHAVKEIFPMAILGIGPNVEDGFYYDIGCEISITEDDLLRIEEKMRELSKKDIKLQRKELTKDEAVALFSNLGEKYKVELIKDLPQDALITAYQQDTFIDLCRGPHVASTVSIKFFKLTKIAGAYWRGDAKNDVLQRIYGTVWPSQAELDAYLNMIEEAKKRDHRLIAKKLDLFHFQEEAPGLVFWHPNGWIIYQEIRKYITASERRFGYEEIATPIILDRVLWEQSGHWDKYAENMFITSSENHTYALKPMNCPGHIQVFKHGLKSYRDLPVRYAEFCHLHRNEYSGALHGLFRVRGFVQDDGHLFCTEDQIESESLAYIDQLLAVYAAFGFKDVAMRLSTRPIKRIGSDEVWDKAEKALISALDAKNAQWQLAPGDGAFYGPKIDFHLKDCLGRNWQCGTLQLDFQMPASLDAYYIAEDGSKKHPVMLHRAMLGSIERFLGILLENTYGNLPLWLTPLQIVVLNITNSQVDYAKQVGIRLSECGFRAKSDLRNEKIGYKIREHTLQKVFYLLVVGDKEMTSGTVAVRGRDGSDLGVMSLDAFITLAKKEAQLTV